MRSLVACWKNTNEMPRLLRMFCQGGMVATPILFVFLVLPLNDWKVNGQEVTYSRLWLSGTGVVFALFLILGGVGTWGLAARSPNARWALVLTPMAPCLFGFLFPTVLPSIQFSLSLLLQATVTGALVYAYLFHASSVSAYLRLSESEKNNA